MAAVLDEIAAQKIQQLETTLYAAEKRNRELARQIGLLNSENDRLRDDSESLRKELQTLRGQYAALAQVEDE